MGAALVGGCGESGYKFVNNFLHNSLNLQSFNSKLFKWCFNGLPFVDQLDNLLAHKTYLVLLQNNRELRPSGGFMGSYAKLSFTPSGLASFEVQDIYVPDGQIAGHVDPPLPLQQAFGQGGWQLRDSNWDPDFTVAAQQIAWFLAQGGEKVDGLVAVNLTLVNNLLQVLGEIKTTDYQQVSAQTFYDLAQKYAEVDFFPGSTQKRDFLGAVGNALVSRIMTSSPVEKLKLGQVVWRQLKQGEVLVWFKDKSLEETVRQRHWDGGLGEPTGDYLYIVETNLGANKANCCVTREVSQDVNGSQEKLTIKYQNTNSFTNPKPPYSWGGNYIDYLRVIIPVGAEVHRVKVAEKELVEKPLDNQYGLQEDRYQVDEKGKFKVIGFWAVVLAQQSKMVEVNYQLPTTSYSSILVKHQPGMGPVGYRLIYGGKMNVDKHIDRQEVFTLK